MDFSDTKITRPDQLTGIPIIFRDSLGTWKEKPRPRTRRYSLIRKWMKTKRYFEPDPNVYIMPSITGGKVILGHPDTVYKLIARLNEESNG